MTKLNDSLKDRLCSQCCIIRCVAGVRECVTALQSVTSIVTRNVRDLFRTCAASTRRFSPNSWAPSGYRRLRSLTTRFARCDFQLISNAVVYRMLHSAPLARTTPRHVHRRQAR